MHVLIVVNANLDAEGTLTPGSAIAAKMVDALQQAIATDYNALSATEHSVQLATPATAKAWLPPAHQKWLICPLTLDLPEGLPFAHQALYQQCREVDNLRAQVRQIFNVAIAAGHYWLPIVWTRKGPLYAEVIGMTATEAKPDQLSADLPADADYHQPLHLPDRWRQPLYRLAGGLLRSLTAPPGTYLLQFGLHDNTLFFDRLFPFPAAPAIASIGVQLPNLFTCHWYCLTDQPLHDVVILSRPYQSLQSDSINTA